MNSHVVCHTDEEVVDVCGETLMKWRRMTGASKMVDLKSAYYADDFKEDIGEDREGRRRH